VTVFAGGFFFGFVCSFGGCGCWVVVGVVLSFLLGVGRLVFSLSCFSFF